MRKWIGIFLAAVLMLSLFTACGDDKDSANPTNEPEDISIPDCRYICIHKTVK